MDEQVLRNILKFTKRLKKDPYTKLYAPLADGYRQVGLLEDSVDKCLVGRVFGNSPRGQIDIVAARIAAGDWSGRGRRRQYW